MPAHLCPVLIEMGVDRHAAGINARSKAEPAEVSPVFERRAGRLVAFGLTPA